MPEGKHDQSTSRSEYDVIIVGAGPGGSAAALTLARRGVRVLVLEKSRAPGEGNVSGGVLYGDFTKGHGLIDLVPEFESEAPLERKVLSHEVNILSAPDTRRGIYHRYRLHGNSALARLGLFTVEIQTGHDYSVIRRDFDRWLAEKAVAAGAVLSTGTNVRSLLLEGDEQEDGSDPVVVGVRTSAEEIRAKVVVDCSGVNSNLVQEAGLRRSLGPRHLYHAMRRVYRLPQELIDRRFRVREGEGRAINCFGDFMMGVSGSSFIVTNRDSVSVGVIASLDSMVRVFTERFDSVGRLVEVLDAFEAHPFTADFLEGAELLEASAHNIPRGNVAMLKKPYASGYLVTGDALGAFIKIGPLFDGLRRAIATGIMAAEAYLLASESGSFRGSNLSRYKEMLAPVYEDVNRYGRESFFGESGLAYSFIPKVLFSSSAFSKSVKFDPGKARPGPVGGKTGGGEPAGIRVDVEAASSSSIKPWVPTCPTNCFTLITPKGSFVSYKDLYEANLKVLASTSDNRSGLDVQAYRETVKDMLEAKVGFDPASCVGCGNCWAIGPPSMVALEVEGSRREAPTQGS